MSIYDNSVESEHVHALYGSHAGFADESPWSDVRCDKCGVAIYTLSGPALCTRCAAEDDAFAPFPEPEMLTPEAERAHYEAFMAAQVFPEVHAPVGSREYVEQVAAGLTADVLAFFVAHPEKSTLGIDSVTLAAVYAEELASRQPVAA